MSVMATVLAPLLTIAMLAAPAPPGTGPAPDGAAPTPPADTAPREVVVTGQRPLVLTVDFDEIWLRCAACKTERSKLRAIAAPMITRQSAVRSSVMSDAPDLQTMQDNAGRGYLQTIENARGYRHDSQSIVAQPPTSTTQAAAAAEQRMNAEARQFLDRLGARVTELSEARRIALGAKLVQRSREPVASGARTTDITRWLIAELDRDPTGLIVADVAPKAAE